MGNKTAGEIQGPRQCLKDGNEKLVTERLSGLFQARTEVKKNSDHLQGGYGHAIPGQGFVCG
jgi:hypothetical protein